jgi:hypothetical protein
VFDAYVTRVRVRRAVRAVAASVGGITLVAGLGVLAMGWLLLPPRMPEKALHQLSPRVRNVMRTADEYIPAHFARIHLAALEESGELRRVRSIRRNVREFVVSVWLSLLWNADDIVDAYADRVLVGGQRRGLTSGAAALFGTRVEALSSAQLALLVAVIQNPTRLDPACRPAHALDARNRQLERMREAGLLTPEQTQLAVAEPVAVRVTCGE